MAQVADEELTMLDAAAREAAKRSYSPYSNFPVGSALLTADRSVVMGCNVENASLGISLCSERCAIFAARSLGHFDPHLALSVICLKGDPAKPTSLMPCGACRQIMAEMLAPDAVISVIGVGRFQISELLPHAFTLG